MPSPGGLEMDPLAIHILRLQEDVTRIDGNYSDIQSALDRMRDSIQRMDRQKSLEISEQVDKIQSSIDKLRGAPRTITQIEGDIHQNRSKMEHYVGIFALASSVATPVMVAFLVWKLGLLG